MFELSDATPSGSGLRVQNPLFHLQRMASLSLAFSRSKRNSGETSLHLETKVKMVSCLNSSNVLLMTAAVDVVSSSGVRRKVRAFIDQGSQASFVTSDLVSSLEAPQIREVNLSIQEFSGKTDSAQTSVHELRVIDCSGTYHVLNVIKRKALNLDIPTISADVIQRWRERGIEVS